MGDPADASAELDLERLDELAEAFGEDAPRILRELVDIFERDLPVRVAAVVRAAEGDGGEDLVRAAHGLKSSAGNLGVRRLRAEADRIETLARASEFAQSRSQAARMAPVAEAAVRALEGWMAKRFGRASGAGSEPRRQGSGSGRT